MAKLDKSKYTKEQFKKLLAERKKEKALQELQKETQPVRSTTEPAITPIVPNSLRHTEYAFIIGNGTSRVGIDLKELKPFGKIYGCNALYREFDPDYLVAVDVKMINEINEAKYQLKNPNVWTNPNKAFRNYEGFNYFSPSKGWSSGPTALWLSTQHAPKKVFILGFDYKGLEDGKRVNNIYAGTPNYKRTTDGATYYGNWLRQTSTIIKTNTRIAFYRVIQPDNFIPPELNKFNNLKHVFVEDFKKMFSLS